jgi:hypothetical protein
MTAKSTAKSIKVIQVYEWKEGAPRPGTVEKLRETRLDDLELPTNGQVPQKDDIVTIHIPGSGGWLNLVRFRVVERELGWNPLSRELGGGDDDAPMPWHSMMLHVRRVADENDGRVGG